MFCDPVHILFASGVAAVIAGVLFVRKQCRRPDTIRQLLAQRRVGDQAVEGKLSNLLIRADLLDDHFGEAMLKSASTGKRMLRAFLFFGLVPVILWFMSMGSVESAGADIRPEQFVPETSKYERLNEDMRRRATENGDVRSYLQTGVNAWRFQRSRVAFSVKKAEQARQKARRTAEDRRSQLRKTSIAGFILWGIGVVMLVVFRKLSPRSFVRQQIEYVWSEAETRQLNSPKNLGRQYRLFGRDRETSLRCVLSLRAGGDDEALHLAAEDNCVIELMESSGGLTSFWKTYTAVC